ncbi:MAG: ABC transporter ATP-binding protein [Lachnospiraceae bacterium]|nr:ABC transporter ATP-binding protein [Lachnospiraceae bacterium]MDE7434347.1 ABC transporter ATP-binding protein [Lachnospiraceae bacterium]
MAYIEIDHVTTTYGNGKNVVTALEDVSLSIEKGEFICLIGPSGCGKTTLLNAIAGFEKISSGSITIDGKPVTKPRIEYITIFQNYGLLPWRTVQKNVEFGMEKRRIPKEDRSEAARRYIKQVGLEGFEDRYPHQLSGGQQQRVAIARALAVEPDILFMDEPFGALDAITRMKLQDDVMELSKTEKKTIIFVTHDIEEAVFLADRIIILGADPGHIKGIATVQLSKGHDRTSDVFIQGRDKVFELLDMKHRTEDPIEYYI